MLTLTVLLLGLGIAAFVGACLFFQEKPAMDCSLAIFAEIAFAVVAYLAIPMSYKLANALVGNGDDLLFMMIGITAAMFALMIAPITLKLAWAWFKGSRIGGSRGLCFV